jgi:hypothetical protein
LPAPTAARNASVAMWTAILPAVGSALTSALPSVEALPSWSFSSRHSS